MPGLQGVVGHELYVIPVRIVEMESSTTIQTVAHLNVGCVDLLNGTDGTIEILDQESTMVCVRITLFGFY